MTAARPAPAPTQDPRRLVGWRAAVVRLVIVTIWLRPGDQDR